MRIMVAAMVVDWLKFRLVTSRRVKEGSYTQHTGVHGL
jgi:hypothetical protein